MAVPPAERASSVFIVYFTRLSSTNAASNKNYVQEEVKSILNWEIFAIMQTTYVQVTQDLCQSRLGIADPCPHSCEVLLMKQNTQRQEIEAMH
jgi:hypothetical protein